MEELSREELWEICKNLPPILKEAVFSAETSDAIWSISKLHDIEDVPKLAKFTGQVLMGLLPLEFFKDKIKEELDIDEDKAKKISLEMEHFVFNQVRKEIQSLYSEDNTEKKQEPEIKTYPDTYREEIE